MYRTTLFFLANAAIVSLARAQQSNATTVCCSQTYPALAGEPCDLLHYCNYTDQKAYAQTQLGGIIVLILMTVVSATLVGLRDILKVFTPAKVSPVPDRQLTTMSAAYASDTMVPLKVVEVQNVAAEA